MHPSTAGDLRCDSLPFIFSDAAPQVEKHRQAAVAASYCLPGREGKQAGVVWRCAAACLVSFMAEKEKRAAAGSCDWKIREGCSDLLAEGGQEERLHGRAWIWCWL
jgi:hypothetical protein